MNPVIPDAEVIKLRKASKIKGFKASCERIYDKYTTKMPLTSDNITRYRIFVTRLYELILNFCHKQNPIE